jgi:HEAT repeat protein
MMKLRALLSAASVVLFCAAVQGQDNEGRSLDEWRARTHTPFSVAERRKAIRAVAQLGWKRTLSGHPKPEDAQWTAREITPTLVELLDDQSESIRLEAALSLGGPFASVDPQGAPRVALLKLMRLVGDKNADIRKVAAGDIVSIRPVQEKEVARLLGHKDIVVRHAAATAILYARPFQAVETFRPALLKLMNADADFCRRNVQLLPVVGTGAVPILVKLLDDKAPGVRSNSALALSRLGPAAKQAAPALKRLLTDMAKVFNNDKGHRVCHSAGEALNRILGDKNYLAGLPSKPPDGL